MPLSRERYHARERKRGKDQFRALIRVHFRKNSLEMEEEVDAYRAALNRRKIRVSKEREEKTLLFREKVSPNEDFEKVVSVHHGNPRHVRHSVRD